MNDDIETIRKALESSAGHWSQAPEAALDRLEAELNEARESRDQHFAGRQHNAREAERLRLQGEDDNARWREVYDRKCAEVERLRKQWDESFAGKTGRISIALEDEVEKLRAERDALTKILADEGYPVEGYE
jgi:predicted nuclease with TOPRIM domain